MSMETTAWTQLYSVLHAEQDRRPLARATVRRIAAFARPHRARIGWFVVLSVATALLAVATPVLAGQVVNAFVSGSDPSLVTRLALLIAAIAVAEAGLGMVARGLSSRLGEGLILDLRTAVFDHVQRMPVAFFTRTRTGALVSRLNNDVIGAQRAFSDTLAGIVSNVATLVLAFVVMIGLSWQVTLLALVLLPVFVLPARRTGRRMAALRREAAEHNSAMSTRMTERFSAPGATLVKLFGRPADESAEFAGRARRVRDIGVRTAMAEYTFITALTLVSALALALVYGLGGRLALSGALEPGAVVSLALLLTRLYAPLTALAGARLEVMTALVSFERVFEVLDLKPLIAAPEHPRALPDGPSTSPSRTSSSPTRPPTRSPSPPWRRSPPSTAARAPRFCTASASAPSPARPSPWSAPPAPASPPSPPCCPASTTPTRAPCGSAARTSATSMRTPCATPSAWSPRTATSSTSRSAPTSFSPAPPPPRRNSGTRCAAPASTASSPRCRTASTPSSANAATGSPAASASA